MADLNVARFRQPALPGKVFVMRSLLAPLISLATLCAVSEAHAATYVLWQGDAVLTAATAACSAAPSYRDRLGVGTVFKSSVRPALIGDNGNDSRLLFVHDTLALFALDLAGGLTLPGAGTYAAYGVTVYDGTTTSAPIKTNVGGQYQAFTLTPAAPTATTAFVNLRGTIQNFMFISGCTVTFRGNYSLRPSST